MGEDNRSFHERIKSVDMKANTSGEGDYLAQTDVQGRKGRERTGLETLVVYPLKYGCRSLDIILEVKFTR